MSWTSWLGRSLGTVYHKLSATYYKGLVAQDVISSYLHLLSTVIESHPLSPATRLQNAAQRPSVEPPQECVSLIKPRNHHPSFKAFSLKTPHPCSCDRNPSCPRLPENPSSNIHDPARRGTVKRKPASNGEKSNNLDTQKEYKSRKQRRCSIPHVTRRTKHA